MLRAQTPELTRVSTWAATAHMFVASRRWVKPLVWSLSILTSAIAVFLYSSGLTSLARAALILAAPAVLLITGWRPHWVVLGLVAIPPGFVALTNYRPLATLLAVTLIAQFIIHRRLFLGPQSGLYPLVLLAISSLFFKANVGADAAVAAGNFYKQLIYYLLLGLLSYNLAKSGALRLGHLVAALLSGTLLTAFLKLAISGIGPAPPFRIGEVSQLYFGRDYAYVTFIGFSICFAGFILASEDPKKFGRYRSWSLGLGFLFLILTATSLVRGSWLVIILTVAVIAWVTPKPSYWVLIPLAAVLAFSVPIARERLVPSQSNTDFTTGRWELWSTVWNEHMMKGLPSGHGFGYAWSLTPDRLFGFSTFVYEGEEIVYLHSDLLFWMVEFGFFGLAAMLVFWSHLAGTYRRLYRNSDPYLRSSAILLTGVLVGMFMTTVFGNALSLRPLSERFFVASGFLFGLLAASKRRDVNVVATAVVPGSRAGP